MRAENFLYFNNNRIQGEDLLPVKCIKVPQWLRLLSVLRRWSVVVDFLFIVTPVVGVCNCSFFCCMLLYVHSSIAIILMGKRELVALLNMSSWCLVMVELCHHGSWLFLAVPWVICCLWLWYFLIILTYYFWYLSNNILLQTTVLMSRNLIGCFRPKRDP